MDILFPPPLLMGKNRAPSPCKSDEYEELVDLRLCAAEASTMTSNIDEEAKPTVTVDFSLEDCTEILFPAPARPTGYYAFPCPLIEKPFCGRFHFEASQLSSSLEDCHRLVRARAMIPPDFPMKREHRDYLEMEMSKLLHRAVVAVGEAEAADSKFLIAAFLKRKVGYEETAEVGREMEAATAGRWRDHRMSNKEKIECAVCFEAVEEIWSRKVQLLCGHEFHSKCIAPWLTMRNTASCPLCRGHQLDVRTVLQAKFDSLDDANEEGSII